MEAVRSLAVDHPAHEFATCLFRQGVETLVPVRMRRGALLADIPPGLQDIVGNLERAVIPAQRLLGTGQFLGAERFAVGFRGAGAGRRAEADDGLAGDERGPVRILGVLDRGGDGLLVMAIDPDGIPAMGLEARHLIDAVGQRQRAVDRDAVVVPQEDQLRQLEMAGQSRGFVADALHQVAVGAEHIRVMIDDVAIFGRQQPFRQRGADRGRDALAQRAGGGLDAGGDEVLGVARGLGMQLAKVLQLIQRDVLVAGQIQQRIEQHRAVAGGEDETVAVRPARIGGIELQELGPQHRGDIGGAHRQPRMAGIGLLHAIHRQRADRIGHLRMINLRHVGFRLK